ncbi:MAG: VOC family protein [Panacagrimonas sp.]
MIAYVTLGTNDMARACRFYDALLDEIGGKRFMDTDRIVVWASAPNVPMMSVCKPWDGKAATVGNGVMVALAVDSKATVDRLYNKALELGGTDEGAPGSRGPGFYIGYFRDLDGNKLNFFTSN